MPTIFPPGWRRVIAQELVRRDVRDWIGWVPPSALRLTRLGTSLALAGALGGEYRRGYREAIRTVGR
jgi:hypothetical protein